LSLRVFISYSSRDRSSAFEIIRLLEQHDCDVWLDYFDIKPTEILNEELSDNLEQAEVVCILLSPTSVDSRWVIIEAELALKQRARGLRVLPLILRPCNILDLLDDLVAIDATDGLADEAVALRIVCAVLGGEGRRSGPAVCEPEIRVSKEGDSRGSRPAAAECGFKARAYLREADP
jgi:hypothetical protein